MSQTATNMPVSGPNPVTASTQQIAISEQPVAIVQNGLEGRVNENKNNGYSWKSWAIGGAVVATLVGGIMYAMSDPTVIANPTLWDQARNMVGYPLPTEPTIMDTAMEVGSSAVQSVVNFIIGDPLLLIGTATLAFRVIIAGLDKATYGTPKATSTENTIPTFTELKAEIMKILPLCVPIVSVGGLLLGRSISVATGEYVQLNNLVPQSIRTHIRELALSSLDGQNRIFRPILQALGTERNSIDKIIAIITLILRNKPIYSSVDYSILGQNIITTIGAPIWEELEYRLPLLAAHNLIRLPQELDSLDSDTMSIKNALVIGFRILPSIFGSIMFTYSHDDDLSPDRAAFLFVLGLFSSYLALNKGLSYAIAGHMFNNLLVCIRDLYS